MKNKVRSKVLIFMLCLILSGMAMLGCSNGSEQMGDEPELASVSFGVMKKGSEKVISISREAPDYETLYWSYTAEWKGDTGVTPVGAQSEKKAVKDDAGLAELGGFTPGKWEFKLFGYSDSGRTNLVLSGTSGEVVLSASLETPVTVVVDYNNDSGKGTIKLGEITFKEGTGYTLESITVDGGTEQITNLSDKQLTDIAAGSHTVYLKYSATDGGYYEATVQVTVSAGVTTVIEGQLDLLVAAAPTGLTGIKPSYYGQIDGKITGLNSTKLYEYSTDGNIWTQVAENSIEITGLAAGDYKVRISGVRLDTAVDVKVPAGDFRIVLCAGDGIGDDIYASVEVDSSYTVPACPSTFNAPGIGGLPNSVVSNKKFFKCWTTKEDGSETAYEAGAKIQKVSSDIVLYAQWTKPSFTVGVDSEGTVKKVYFAKGNLQATYDSSRDTKYTWDFAEHQYDYIGNASGNITIDSQTDGAKVDLFGWSTEATNYGINTSTNIPDYSGAFKDWGGIESLPGNISITKVWRTLSKGEWDYLLNTSSRMINSKPCYSNFVGGVSIGGTTYKGIFLYPDNYNGDVISGSMTWGEINAAGIVFLPAAGSRGGTNVNYENPYEGSYWSSSADSTSAVYNLSFGGDNTKYDNLCFVGRSVRLVWDE